MRWDKVRENEVRVRWDKVRENDVGRVRIR